MPRFGPPPPPGGDPPGTEQLIADGWGFAFLNPGQRAGRQRRRPHEGHHRPREQGTASEARRLGRAARLGVGRAARSITSRPITAVDAKHVGIDGVSRYGKAALVTMAFDPRFAVVLVGSSGEGGAKLHRRNFGEAVENLTGSGEYHWMAGNFLKYGASEATFGSKNAGDLPVDAHELIALCAPRLTFISYGVPEKGDAKWLDQQGSFMAAVAARPVFRLLGAKDLGVGDDYRNAKMPPVNEGLLDGQLAWRQHDGGHTDGPNWKYFIPWADKYMRRTTAPPISRTAAATAARGPRIARAAHRRQLDDSRTQQLLEKRKQGKIDVYFVGDSITRRWGATDYPELLANWNAELLRLERGRLRLGRRPDREHALANRERRARRRQPEGHRDRSPARTTSEARRAATPRSTTSRAACARWCERCRDKAPNATIVLTAIFPRNDNMAVDAGDRSRSTGTSRAWPTARRYGISMSTTGWPTETACCSTA